MSVRDPISVGGLIVASLMLMLASGSGIAMVSGRIAALEADKAALARGIDRIEGQLSRIEERIYAMTEGTKQ